MLIPQLMTNGEELDQEELLSPVKPSLNPQLNPPLNPPLKPNLGEKSNEFQPPPTCTSYRLPRLYLGVNGYYKLIL